MTSLSLKVIFLCTASLIATPSNNAFGQFKDVPPKYEEFGIVCLLGFPSVVEHLQADYELGQDNLKTLKELGRNRLRNMHLRRDFRQKTYKMNGDQFTRARAKLCKTIQKLNSESWGQAAKLLNEQQIARLKQLRLQRLGPAALMDAEVIQALGLKGESLNGHLRSAMAAKKTHDETLIRLKADMLAARRSMKLAPQSREDFEWNWNYSKTLADAKASERGKVFSSVLTQPQQAKLDSLFGDPFVFKLDFDFPGIKVDWQTAPIKDLKK